MIKSPHELDITKNMVSNFQHRLTELVSLKDTSSTVTTEIYAIKTMIGDLNSQINWYNDTIDGKISFDTVNSLSDLPMVIVGKRLQRKIQPGDLASAIGISEQVYVALEDDDFYGIESTLLYKILNFLRIQNTGNILNEDYLKYIDIVESNLKSLKISKSFIAQIMPVTLEDISIAIKSAKSEANFLFERFIETFKNYFSIDLRSNITRESIANSFAVAFKRRVNINADNLNFTTSFAAHIAWVISKQMKYASKTMRADPISIRSSIIKCNGEVTFESCLDYIWDLNIAVLPLDIKRGFNGACFDFDDRKVIVLNQQTDTISRWKFDLLHELYHALTMEYSAYIERVDIMQQNDEEEKNASNFASFVIFGQEVDSFIKIVLERSRGNVQFIKNIIIDVAQQFKLNVDDFSNYVAYRINSYSINLWGTAANIQSDKRSAKEVTRNYLLEKLDYSSINSNDLLVIQRSILERVIL